MLMIGTGYLRFGAGRGAFPGVIPVLACGMRGVTTGGSLVGMVLAVCVNRPGSLNDT